MVPLLPPDRARNGAAAVAWAHVTVPLRTLPGCGDGISAVVIGRRHPR
jgi:hypothetical protein